MRRIDVRVLGEEYRNRDYTGRQICLDRGIEIYFNQRDHRFSSTALRISVTDAEIRRHKASQVGDTS